MVVAACGDSGGGSGLSGSSPGVVGTAPSASSTTAPGAAVTPSSTSAKGATVTPSSTAPVDVEWPTFGAGADRQGFVGTGPNPGTLGLAWSSDELDGDLYGEPIVSGGRVVVATEHDTVYAFDVRTGEPAWNVNLGDPVPRSALPCGNIDPTGVTGTPVVDANTATVYAVVFVRPGRHDLVAINLSDGSIRWRRAADAPGLDPLVEQQRAALTIVQGRVYVLYGGLFGDCGPYKGAVVSFQLDGEGDPQSWIVPTTREGGLWAPSGAAVDSTGDLLVSVGNTESTDRDDFDDGNATVRLTPDLHAVDDWAPADWYTLNGRDADLGSIGPLPLDDGRIFVAGKNGVGYLLDGGDLGGIGGELASTTVCDGGAFGGSATNGSIIVVGCSGGPAGVGVTGDGTLSVAWHGPGGRSGAPIIAADTVWLVANDGHLYALDVGTGAVKSDTDLHGPIPGFPTPTVLADMILVGDNDRLLAFTG